MKTYREFITEATAVAKKRFKKKFDAVRHSDAFQNRKYRKGDVVLPGINAWHLTGHNPGSKHGTTKDIEAVKERVFGKRRKGTSDLLFMHKHHGVVVHPAIGDVTHRDVIDHLGQGRRKGVRVSRKIQAKVKEGGIGAIMGQGRIEHHEGGGGIISYHHIGGTPRSAAIRSISRHYPKYQIHDGQGNLLESEDFKSKWNKLLDSPEWQKSPPNATQWQLTGHNPGTKHGTTHEIEKAKERVFGKRRGNTDLFWLHFHHGLVTHPAKGDIVHTDVEENRKRKGVKVDKKIAAKVAEGGIGSRWGLGRIEHHEGGGGIITYHHRGGVSKSSAVRMISREYPKYQIHDGQGNLLEAVKAKGKPGKSFGEKFKALRARLAKSKDDVAVVASQSPWILTGHDHMDSLSSDAVRKAKEKVFGKREGQTHLFWYHKDHGLITHPAHGEMTHGDISYGSRSGRTGIDPKVHAMVDHKTQGQNIQAQGRIEHHAGGGGMISVGTKDDRPAPAHVIRRLRREYPKHIIHDGTGNELHENWSYAHDFHQMPDSEKQKYVYHVTTAARAKKIVKGGLKPRSPKGRTNYPSQKEHTQGHAFVTNHHGVRYWVDQTAHAVNRRKHEVDENDYENIHVVKFPIANLSKSARRKFKSDDLGTKDSRKHSDYARDPIIDPSSHEAPTAFKIRKKVK